MTTIQFVTSLANCGSRLHAFDEAARQRSDLLCTTGRERFADPRYRALVTDFRDLRATCEDLIAQARATGTLPEA